MKGRILATIGCIFLILSGNSSRGQDVRAEFENIVRDYLASHPDEIGEIVKGYLIRHPDALREVLVEAVKRRQPGMTPAGADKAAVIRSNAAALFDSAHQVTLGNAKGGVTIVEFFDYNCGFCKRALADTEHVLKSHPDVKLVLKEFPILGPGSVEAARVGIAVRMQDPSGEKYLEFHRVLLGGRGPADRARAMAVAQQIGLDAAQLERDAASDEVRETLEENAKLARALGVSGTPSYVVGDAVVPGAVGIAVLEDRIKTARK